MEQVLFAFLVLCVTARASDEHYDSRPVKVVSHSTGSDTVTCHTTGSVMCNIEDNEIRTHFIEQSRCGEPKYVFVHLTPPSAEKHITPGVVWVKRCVGDCNYNVTYSVCHPRETVFRRIPIRITNVETGKESCSSYNVEEHVSCECCSLLGDTCRPAQSQPSRCACQCPHQFMRAFVHE